LYGYIAVRLMTNDECHPELWKGANRKFKKVPWQKKAAEKHDR
jgi:nucleolar protein 15